MKNRDEELREWRGRQGLKAHDEANRKGYADYERERAWKEKRKQAEQQGAKGSCWVATAFYGSESDPNVQCLRDLRDHLKHQPVIGKIVDFVNEIYHSIGGNTFGMWWSNELAKNLTWSPVRIVTKPILSLALILSKFVRHERRS